MVVLLVTAAAAAGLLQVLLVLESSLDELTEDSIHVSFTVREKPFEVADVPSVWRHQESHVQRALSQSYRESCAYSNVTLVTRSTRAFRTNWVVMVMFLTVRWREGIISGVEAQHRDRHLRQLVIRTGVLVIISARLVAKHHRREALVKLPNRTSLHTENAFWSITLKNIKQLFLLMAAWHNDISCNNMT